MNELVFNVTWLYPENIQEYTICEDFTALQLPTTLSYYNSSSCHLYPIKVSRVIFLRPTGIQEAFDHLLDWLLLPKSSSSLCGSSIHLHSFADTPKNVM